MATPLHFPNLHRCTMYVDDVYKRPRAMIACSVSAGEKEDMQLSCPRDRSKLGLFELERNDSREKSKKKEDKKKKDMCTK